MVSKGSPRRSPGSGAAWTARNKSQEPPWPARTRSDPWECLDLEVPWAGPGSVRLGSVSAAFTLGGAVGGDRPHCSTLQPCWDKATSNGDRWPGRRARGAPWGLTTLGSPLPVLLPFCMTRHVRLGHQLQAKCEPGFEPREMDSEN